MQRKSTRDACGPRLPERHQRPACETVIVHRTCIVVVGATTTRTIDSKKKSRAAPALFRSLQTDLTPWCENWNRQHITTYCQVLEVATAREAAGMQRVSSIVIQVECSSSQTNRSED